MERSAEHGHCQQWTHDHCEYNGKVEHYMNYPYNSDVEWGGGDPGL